MLFNSPTLGIIQMKNFSSAHYFFNNLFSVRNICFWFQKRKSQQQDFPKDGNSGPSLSSHERPSLMTRRCGLDPSAIQAPKVPNSQKLQKPQELAIKVKGKGQQMDRDRWRTAKKPGDTTGQPDDNRLSGFLFSSHSDLADLSSLWRLNTFVSGHDQKCSSDHLKSCCAPYTSVFQKFWIRFWFTFVFTSGEAGSCWY